MPEVNPYDGKEGVRKYNSIETLTPSGVLATLLPLLKRDRSILVDTTAFNGMALRVYELPDATTMLTFSNKLGRGIAVVDNADLLSIPSQPYGEFTEFGEVTGYVLMNNPPTTPMIQITSYYVDNVKEFTERVIGQIKCKKRILPAEVQNEKPKESRGFFTKLFRKDNKGRR